MTTINKEEIQKFSNLADEWWDVEGKFKPLHMFNPIRLEYITEKIVNHFNLENKKDISLKKLTILDIGCGGGLISEPLSRLGGIVTGIDASEKNIKVAELHSKKNNLKIRYLNKSPEQLMFTATLNRTLTSYVKAIVGAEYILRWLPIGTHDWNKFIKPEDLEKLLQKQNFRTIDIKGLSFNPIFKKWKQSEDLSVNYIICSTKN